jgi:hypothetical protein
MARNSNSKRNKNSIQNVRIVDRDEGTDDIICQRLLQSYNDSEGQIRVVCGYQGNLNFASGAAGGGVVAFGELIGTDDFTSFSAQYQEYRVRAIRFDIYDINPNSSAVVNYWSTFHQIGGDVPVGQENVMDRPDARSVAPGDGKVTLAWVAHGIPEMQFNSVSINPGLGGLSYYNSPSGPVAATKYTVMAKYIVDFRGRK